MVIYDYTLCEDGSGIWHLIIRRHSFGVVMPILYYCRDTRTAVVNALSVFLDDPSAVAPDDLTGWADGDMAAEVIEAIGDDMRLVVTGDIYG